MSFTQSFKLALKSLRTSKMRALLTMLGIIIGVGAVIVILSLGNGMQNMMNEQFEKLGSNLLQVQVWRPEDGSTRTVLTKSGGFGGRELLAEVHQALHGGIEDATVYAHHSASGI